MVKNIMEALVHASEKAANIARLCRCNEHLFPLLVQEKPIEESNPRFVKDFKTLADVLIQQTIRYDVGNLVCTPQCAVFILERFHCSTTIFLFEKSTDTYLVGWLYFWFYFRVFPIFLFLLFPSAFMLSLSVCATLSLCLKYFIYHSTEIDFGELLSEFTN